MKEKNKSRIAKIMYSMPFIICLGSMVIYLILGRNVTLESIAEFVPVDPIRAALFVIILYALKSLSIFFPIVILYILGGFIFEPITAIIVNSLGILTELSIPYWIGRYYSNQTIYDLLRKYPRIAEFIGKKNNNGFFLSFFLRIIAFLPVDAVSIYLGSKSTAFTPYLIGSFIGILPSMIAATLMGTNITNPYSPTFIICAGITVGIAVISLLIHLSLKRNVNKNRKDNNL